MVWFWYIPYKLNGYDNIKTRRIWIWFGLQLIKPNIPNKPEQKQKHINIYIYIYVYIYIIKRHIKIYLLYKLNFCY